MKYMHIFRHISRLNMMESSTSILRWSCTTAQMDQSIQISFKNISQHWNLLLMMNVNIYIFFFAYFRYFNYWHRHFFLNKYFWFYITFNGIFIVAWSWKCITDFSIDLITVSLYFPWIIYMWCFNPSSDGILRNNAKF